MQATYAIPVLFVFLWSTSYIALKLCAAYAEPATFIVLRASLAALLLIAIVKFQGLTWPKRVIDVVHSALVGILIHGVYAGGIFAALYYGVDAGVCALILGIQPLLTTAISIAWLDESITWLKSTGILLGFTGVMVLVLYSEGGLAERILLDGGEYMSNLSSFGILLCVVALIAISMGMIYQKRFCGKTELMSAACIQYMAAAMFMLPFAIYLETMEINWSWSFIAGLSWLVFALSIGAMTLLMILIRNGEAGAVSNLFYLVPPLVAIEAWIFFDEKIDLLSVVAMLLCMSGVMLVGYSSRLNTGLNRPTRNCI